MLVHGAGGSVGRCVLQLAALNGVRVIGTGSGHSFDEIRRWGATPVRYGDGLLGRTRAVAPDGIDAAVDVVGTDEAIDVSLALVSDRARIATVVASIARPGTASKRSAGHRDRTGRASATRPGCPSSGWR